MTEQRLQELEEVSRHAETLRKQRDQLIQATPGSLREIAKAAGVSHETVRAIKQRKEQR